MATWRRGKRNRQRWSSFADYSWNSYEEKEDMAVAGSITAAYSCWWEVDDSGTGRLLSKPMTRPRNECADVDDALLKLERGESCIVAGHNMEALRKRLKVGA